MTEDGKVFTIYKPTPKEEDRHSLVMVTSTLQEVQHVATHMLLDPEANLFSEITAVNGCTSPATAAKEKRSTPEHIGRTVYAGRVVGDSGFALQEKVFGCRLMHLEKKHCPLFMVFLF